MNCAFAARFKFVPVNVNVNGTPSGACDVGEIPVIVAWPAVVPKPAVNTFEKSAFALIGVLKPVALFRAITIWPPEIALEAIVTFAVSWLVAELY